MTDFSNEESGTREMLLVELAEQLRSAEAARRPVQALTDQAADLTLTEAYRVQRINLNQRLAQGESLVGRKIGLTSKAMQDQLGVDQPDVGAITDRMIVPNGGRADTSEFIAPRVEAELAFRLAQDLGGSITIESVRASIGTVMLAAEIIDSRIRDWKIKLIDTVADNASSAAVVFGPEVSATAELLDSLPDVVVELEAAGEVVGFGAGSAVLGNPLRAVLWLARTLASTGDSLKAGDLILAGAVHASIPLTAGTRYAIHQDSLPSLDFRAV